MSHSEEMMRAPLLPVGISIACAIVLAPLTLVICSSFGNASYYLASTLMVVYSIVPVYVGYESKKPSVKEVAVLAVVCAIGAASRVAFMWLPFFKPTAAVVFLFGMGFGMQVGFMCGSLTMLISGLFFGIGPWLPWQMLSYGLVGFLGGAVGATGAFSQGKLTPPRVLVLGVVSFLIVLAIAGPVLDLCSLFTMVSDITFESALAIFLAGVPVNAISATATFLTVVLFAVPMFALMRTVRQKFGFSSG